MSDKGNDKKSESRSSILLDELYSSQSDGFVDELKKFSSPKFLGGFVNKWLGNPSQWSREQIIAYLEGDLNLPGHEVVFRRIYKHFEAARDQEMMGVLMVVLDRLVRRSRVTTHHYDWSTRQSWSTERLMAKANKSFHDETGRIMEYQWGGRTVKYPLPDRLNRSTNRIFSNKTRNYFRRAAWRHFRFLSYRDPEIYVVEIAKALARYRDSDFAMGENIIDNWSLMHACYFSHDAIAFTAAHTNIVQGRSLSELTASPYQPEAWKSDVAGDSLIKLLINARSTMVRMWAIELVLRDHETAIKNIKLEYLIQLLSSPDANLQSFATDVFEKHPALPTLTIAEWINLIESSSPNLLAIICDAMQKHVSEERLENQQLIDLACAAQNPVAEMGFGLLQVRDEKSPLTHVELMRLAENLCANQTKLVTPWAMERICERGPYAADFVIDFFDSLMRPTRNAAMQWLRNPDSAGYNDAKLWARLIESPFDDVKIELVELLNIRQSRPEKELGELTPVWISVILGVHRGGRVKPKAISQLADHVAVQPTEADTLLPVLAVALRSIRAPEMRFALASVVRLANESPEMKAKVCAAFPELEFPVEATG